MKECLTLRKSGNDSTVFKFWIREGSQTGVTINFIEGNTGYRLEFKPVR